MFMGYVSFREGNKDNILFQDPPVDTSLDVQVADRRNKERTPLLRTTGVTGDDWMDHA